MIQRYGWIAEHKMWLLENCAVKNNKIYPRDKNDIIEIDGRGFKSTGVSVYQGDKPTMCLESIDTEYINDTAYHYCQLCDGSASIDENTGVIQTYKGLILLGFVPAMIYREEILKKYGFFPILTNYGPSETGKTLSTKILFNFFGFLNSDGEPWSGTTPAGFNQIISQLSSWPVWFDEYRNNASRHHKELLGQIRNAYNGNAVQKGGLQGMRTDYRARGCIWLSGEDTAACA